jgi:hypothetical protein
MVGMMTVSIHFPTIRDPCVPCGTKCVPYSHHATGRSLSGNGNVNVRRAAKMERWMVLISI